MSNLVFPNLYGLDFNVKKTPRFKTLVQSAVAPGYETRIALGEDPLFDFDLSYKILRKGYNAQDDVSKLEAFFFARQGQFDSFLVDIGALTKDTAESSVTGQALTPDASNVAPLIRTKPGTTTAESIYEVAGINGNPGSAPVIKKDGSALTIGTDYTIDGPGYSAAGLSYGGLVVTFLTTTSGHTMTADFSWYYRVRFVQDTNESELFFFNLWKCQRVQLMGVRG